MAAAKKRPVVSVILGSESDLKIVGESGLAKIFAEVQVKYEVHIISAHRNLRELEGYCRGRAGVFIGVAGMAAALPGVISAAVSGMVPVLGVALSSANFPDAMDAVLAITRMPAGRPVMFCGIDKAGLDNAAIAACQILATQDATTMMLLRTYLEKTNKAPVYDVSLPVS